VLQLGKKAAFVEIDPAAVKAALGAAAAGKA
jgi:hypothetical protein